MFSTPSLSVGERAGVHHLQCCLVEQASKDTPEPAKSEGQGSGGDMVALIKKLGGGNKKQHALGISIK